MKFLIKTLGCRVNQAESRVMAESLFQAGWRQAKPPDICLVNTCSVTQKAEKETRQEVRRLKREYPDCFLIVTGCAVDYWQQKGKMPDLGADLYLENTKKTTIPNLPQLLIRQPMKKRGRVARVASPRAFLKVQDGCHQFCAYCLVPYLRGRSKSRPEQEVVKEIKALAKKGIKEVILCGINLAAYQPSLTALLKKILDETKIPRIRLGSINLEAFDDELISLWRDSRLCPHFHIPLQSGCDQTLKRMGRGYTIKKFKTQITNLKKRVPEVNITTDILVGFPGETEAEFEESLAYLASLPLAKIHVFRYSVRQGTRAAIMKGQVSEKTKTERARKVRELSQKMREKIAKSLVGKKLIVLFESEKQGCGEGLSRNYWRVWVKVRGLRDKIKSVKIKSQRGGVLKGAPVN